MVWALAARGIAWIGGKVLPGAVGAALAKGSAEGKGPQALKRLARRQITKAVGYENNPLKQGSSAPTDLKKEGYLTSGRLVNALYSIDASLRMADRVAGLVRTSFHHSIVVAVKGGPAASMTRTWQLACALAFGQYRQAIGIASDVSCDATWDLSAKSVQITLFYQLGFQSELGARTFIQRGPITETVGGGWPGFLTPLFNNPIRPGEGDDELFAGMEQPIGLLQGRRRVVGGRPVQAGEDIQLVQAILDRRAALVNAGLQGQFEVLPDEGRLILTEIKDNPYVQPPAPDDYGDLISLVANALTDPGFQPTEPPPGRRLGNPDGAQLFAPGVRISDSVLNGKLRELQNVGLRGIVGGVLGIAGAAINFALAAIGKDGYTKRHGVPSVQGPTHDGY